MLHSQLPLVLRAGVVFYSQIRYVVSFIADKYFINHKKNNSCKLKQYSGRHLIFFPISWLLLTGDNMKIQTDMQMLRISAYYAVICSSVCLVRCLRM